MFLAICIKLDGLGLQMGVLTENTRDSFMKCNILLWFGTRDRDFSGTTQPLKK